MRIQYHTSPIPFRLELIYPISVHFLKIISALFLSGTLLFRTRKYFMCEHTMALFNYLPFTYVLSTGSAQRLQVCTVHGTPGTNQYREYCIFFRITPLYSNRRCRVHSLYAVSSYIHFLHMFFKSFTQLVKPAVIQHDAIAE